MKVGHLSLALGPKTISSWNLSFPHWILEAGGEGGVDALKRAGWRRCRWSADDCRMRQWKCIDETDSWGGSYSCVAGWCRGWLIRCGAWGILYTGRGWSAIRSTNKIHRICIIFKFPKYSSLKTCHLCGALAPSFIYAWCESFSDSKKKTAGAYRWWVHLVGIRIPWWSCIICWMHCGAAIVRRWRVICVQHNSVT